MPARKTILTLKLATCLHLSHFIFWPHIFLDNVEKQWLHQSLDTGQSEGELFYFSIKINWWPIQRLNFYKSETFDIT